MSRDYHKEGIYWMKLSALQFAFCVGFIISGDKNDGWYFMLSLAILGLACGYSMTKKGGAQ